MPLLINKLKLKWKVLTCLGAELPQYKHQTTPHKSYLKQSSGEEMFVWQTSSNFYGTVWLGFLRTQLFWFKEILHLKTVKKKKQFIFKIIKMMMILIVGLSDGFYLLELHWVLVVNAEVILGCQCNHHVWHFAGWRPNFHFWPNIGTLQGYKWWRWLW